MMANIDLSQDIETDYDAYDTNQFDTASEMVSWLFALPEPTKLLESAEIVRSSLVASLLVFQPAMVDQEQLGSIDAEATVQNFASSDNDLPAQYIFEGAAEELKH